MNKNILIIVLAAAAAAAAWYFYGQGGQVKNSEGLPAPQESSQKPAETGAQAPASLEEAPIAQAKYSCDGGKTIEAKFYKGRPIEVKSGEMPVPSGKVALVFGDGSTMELMQTVSADGGRYANAGESFIFWDKGSMALVLENGRETNYKNCKISETVEANANNADLGSNPPPMASKECQGLGMPKVVGLTYHEARPQIIKSGWQPLQANANSDKLYGQAKVFFDKGYNEVDDCAGTGKAYCRFFFKDNCSNVMIVVTAGEEIPKLNAYAMIEETRMMAEKEKAALGL